jgi:hypothetical protein
MRGALKVVAIVLGALALLFIVVIVVVDRIVLQPDH